MNPYIAFVPLKVKLSQVIFLLTVTPLVLISHAMLLFPIVIVPVFVESVQIFKPPLVIFAKIEFVFKPGVAENVDVLVNVFSSPMLFWVVFVVT